MDRGTQDTADHALRFLLNPLQLLMAAKTLGVNLVNIFRAGGTGSEPAVLRDHLNASDGIAIARSRGKYALDSLARELGDRDVLRRQLGERGALLRIGRRVDALIGRYTKFALQL